MDIDLETLTGTWHMLRRGHSCSVDRMLCAPTLRADLLSVVNSVCECDDERTIPWNIVNLRKRKSLAQQERLTPPTEHSVCVRPVDTRSDP